jgi:hypothetical protein
MPILLMAEAELGAAASNGSFVRTADLRDAPKTVVC